MVKASTPIFVLLWAYLLGIERITPSLLLVVLVIAIGEFLTVAGEIHFDMVGFCMCLSASVLSGARWTLVQFKLQTLDPPLKTTIATMRVLSPSMFFSMLLVSLIVERPWIALRTGYFETFGEGFSTIGMGMLGAIFAIAMIICEFSLIMRASAIVLMIGGVIKEMITIIVGYVQKNSFFVCVKMKLIYLGSFVSLTYQLQKISVNLFGDTLNRINVAGCLIVFSGVILYKVTYHLAQHDKGDRYRSVDDSQNDNEEEEDASWIDIVPVKLLQNDPKLAFETTASVGIQMDHRQYSGS
jgi:solute carrier family 35 protein C2